MSLFKDIFQIKAIDSKARSLIERHFSALQLKRVISGSEQKNNAKLDSMVSGLKKEARLFIEQESLGYVGRTIFIKKLQTYLQQLPVKSIDIEGLIQRLIC